MKSTLLKAVRSFGKLRKTKHGGCGKTYCATKKIGKKTYSLQINVFTDS